jgi:hypothetical protein
MHRGRPDRGWFHELPHADGRPYDETVAVLSLRLSPG